MFFLQRKLIGTVGAVGAVNTVKMLCSKCKINGHNANNKIFHPLLTSAIENPQIDYYSEDILRHRYALYKNSYIETQAINEKMISRYKYNVIRQQNPPEDVTENIAKFIILNKTEDDSCVWSKSVGLKGDLWSVKQNIIEVKSFISEGPSSFGPDKKFDVIYFLDIRKWLTDEIILWQINLNSNSLVWKNLKINSKNGETHDSQAEQGRRPRIPWEKIKPQVEDYCTRVFRGTFDAIFTKSPASELLVM